MRPVLEDYICIDLEASAFGPRSFPIEVAIVHASTGACQSWLIKPTQAWRDYGAWNPASQAIHGITPDDLLTNGQPVETVAAQLTAACAGKIILSDNPRHDYAWLTTLYAAALIQNPPIQPEFIEPLIWELAAARGRRPDIEYARAEAQAWARHPTQHRATPDAARLAEILRALVD
jgi:DNA polymerase III epsilon subunit-like protein